MLPFISISDSHSANIVQRWHLYNTSMDKNNMWNSKIEKLLLNAQIPKQLPNVPLKSNWDFVVLSLSLPLYLSVSTQKFGAENFKNTSY